MPRSLSPAALVCILILLTGSGERGAVLPGLPWSDIAQIVAIIAAAVLWKGIETFLEE
jgi:hypothetical protein